MIDFEKLSDDQLTIADKIIAEASRQGVDPNLMLAVAFSESALRHMDGKKIVKSPAGAVGVLQLMPETAKSLKINPKDLDDNIRGGVMLMKQNLETYGNPVDAVVAYNTSTATRNKFFETRDFAVLPQETLAYLDKINTIYPLEQQRYVPEAERMAGEPELEGAPPGKSSGVGPYAGAAVGAATGYLEKKAGLPPPARGPEVEAAQRKLALANEKVRIAQDRWASQRIGVGQTIADLETEFKQSQTAAQKAAQELEEIESRARAQGARNVRTRPPTPSPAQHERIIQGTTDDAGTTGRARQTGYTEMTSQQAARRQEAARIQAELERRGLVPKENIYARAPGMTSTPSGVLTPADTVYEAKPPAAAVQAEGDVERARKASGEAQRRAREVERRLAAERSRASKMTGQTPSAVARAEDIAKAAKYEAELAQKMQEGPVSKFGRAVSKVPGTSILAGAGAGLSIEEAIRRWQAGDRSAAVIAALNAVFTGMSLVPHPLTRGIGTAGALATTPAMLLTGDQGSPSEGIVGP
jgi:hypothetical protein